jgi:hypothetical protein
VIAALLQSAGLDLGPELLGPAEGNPRGHFEDVDFLRFHIDVLTAQGLDTNGYVCRQSVRVPEQFRERALALVRARQGAGRPWGWKEPRTVLFLDFWKGLIPHAAFVLLFRSPWEVADSMFRRGDAAFRRNPNLAVQVWMAYNEALLDFQARHPDDCLLVEGRAAAARPGLLVEALRDRFGLHLRPPADLYEEGLFRHQPSPHHVALLRRTFPQALALYARLRQQARMKLDEVPPPVDAGPAAEADWALQYWVDCRHLEKRCADAQAALARTGEELQRARAELESVGARLRQAEAVAGQARADAGRADAELEAVRAELGSVGGQLGQARADAGRTAAELQAARAQGQEAARTAGELLVRLRQAEQDLGEAHRRLDEARAHITWLEGSRFWKARRWWHRWRRPSQADVPGALQAHAVGEEFRQWHRGGG